MEFVDDVVFECDTLPSDVVPLEAIRIHHARWSVDALRLESRNRIGPLFFSVDDVDVVCTGADLFYRRREHSIGAIHRTDDLAPRFELHRDLFHQRRPYAEFNAARRYRTSAKLQPPESIALFVRRHLSSIVKHRYRNSREGFIYRDATVG